MKICSVLFSLFFIGAGLSAADVTLVEKGQAKIAICVPERVMKPDDPNISVELFQRPASVAEFQRQQLRDAVKDLAHYLEKMSGAKIEIVQSSKVPGGSLPIYIGELAVEKFGKPQKSAPFQPETDCNFETTMHALSFPSASATWFPTSSRRCASTTPPWTSLAATPMC